MARKSRKKPIAPLEIQNGQNVQVMVQELKYPESLDEKPRLSTAAYARLSIENNGQEDERSIKTQIALIESYIHENEGLELTETYVDNGFSGTKFDRPEFVRMMNDVKRGKIQCIVVKDLSRFGRDYLETGYYMETIFPLLNVRFIAVTDHFDSWRKEDRNNLAIPVKNMVNAMYAKDASRKQGVYRDMCNKMGKALHYNIPYGYQMCAETGRLEINREVEMYVRMIFSWALSGVSHASIARRLNFLNVPTRSEYEGWNQGGSPWEGSRVSYILSNPTYAGFLVTGKTKVSVYHGISPMRKDEEEWNFFPDRHEAYITMGDYEKLQEKNRQSIEKRQRHLKAREEVRKNLTDCFPQMVYCGTCRTMMRFYRGSHRKGIEKESFQFYRCRYDKEHIGCSHKLVQQNFLKIIVMDQIRELIANVCDKDQVLREIESGKIKSASVEQVRRKISRTKEKEKLLDEKLLRAYMDYVDKLLEEEDYNSIKKKLTKELEKAVATRKGCEERLKEMELAVKAFHNHVERMKDSMAGKGFDEAIIKELVKRIWVYEDGKRIEVEFNCKDIFEDALINEILEEGRCV